MPKDKISADQIDKNWKKFRELLELVSPPRREKLTKLVDDLEERLALAPASGKLKYHCAYPGGLVEHSLNVLNNAFKMSKAFSWECSRESLVIVCLFHDLGKCAHVYEDGKQADVYVTQDSDWHREKLGETYKTNQEVPYMTVPHRSLWLLQKYGIELSYEEWTAILLHDGWSLDENKRYCMNVRSMLVTAVQQADYVSTMEEKEIT